MANHKSAEKRNRQRLKRRDRNMFHLAPMRTYMKRVRNAIAGGEVDEAVKTLPVAVKAISKCATKGIIHKNTASRYISRLTVAVNKAQAA